MASSFVDMEYSNFSPKSVSPGLSSGDDSSQFDNYGGHFAVKDENDANVNNIYSQESVSSDFSSQNGDDNPKVTIRRQKNRESAARSRMKIRNKLDTLENAMQIMENRKKTLANEKDILITEIESLENQMINLSIEKMKGNLVSVANELERSLLGTGPVQSN